MINANLLNENIFYFQLCSTIISQHQSIHQLFCPYVCFENGIVEKDSIENGLLFLCRPQLCIAFLTTLPICMPLKSYRKPEMVDVYYRGNYAIANISYNLGHYEYVV